MKNLNSFYKSILLGIAVIFTFTACGVPAAPAAPVVNPNALVGEAMEAAVEATLKLDGVYLVSDLLAQYETNQMVDACIANLSGSAGMSEEELVAHCVRLYLQPTIITTTAGQLATQMGVGEFCLIQTVPTFLGRSIVSGSWLTPTLVALGFGTGLVTTAYVISSDEYKAKAMTWEYQIVPPETELTYVNFQPASVSTVATTTAITVSSWEEVEAQFAAMTILAEANNLAWESGFNQKTIKGQRGTEFHITVLTTAGVCYLNVFTTFQWWDGSNWRWENIEKEIKKSSACNMMDFVSLFNGLAQNIRDFIKSLGDKFTSEMYNEYAWKVIQDLLDMSMQLMTTQIKEIFGGS